MFRLESLHDLRFNELLAVLIELGGEFVHAHKPLVAEALADFRYRLSDVLRILHIKKIADSRKNARGFGDL